MSNKIATYLRGHVTGEVTTRPDIREAMSVDGGILKLKPEVVIFPRTMNDIRKVTRFSWQLAEKGHKLPITVRGAGLSTSGSSLGKGISLVTNAHLNRVFEYDDKQRLVRLQPGATIRELTESLSLHGTGIHALEGAHGFGTVGGAIASALSGPMSDKHGSLKQSIQELEVVLANGDVMQTKRVSKRELNTIKGKQGLEADIYRGIDNLIEDNWDLIDKIHPDDISGYSAIADVKRKDGSFDLTPLFVGSQGTLGIISEMIMKSEFRSLHWAVAALVFESGEVARDCLDAIDATLPAFVEYFDARLFETARRSGRTYSFYEHAAKTIKPEVVVIVGYDDFSSKNRTKKIKKLERSLAKVDGKMTVGQNEAAVDLLAARDVAYYSQRTDKLDGASPDIFGGFSVPSTHFEEFLKGLDELEEKYHVNLPVSGFILPGIYAIHPMFELSKVGDKQRVFKLMEDLEKLTRAHDGALVSEGGEGRLKARFVRANLDEKIIQLYDDIKKVCDPMGVLNPGVKADVSMKELASMFRDVKDPDSVARYGF